MGTKSMATHTNGATTASSLLADPATRSVLDAIRRIVRALRESSRHAESHVGLSGAQLFVLQRLAGAPALSLNDLAARTLTHQSTVSVVVSRLVERGLVSRSRGGMRVEGGRASLVRAHGGRSGTGLPVPEKVDGRRVEIALTAAGRTALRQAPAAAQDRLIAALGVVGATSRRTLARELDRLVEAMALPEQAPPMFFEPTNSRRSQSRKQGTRGRH
jgi:DNA-binding MarR family transcriptional regulator